MSGTAAPKSPQDYFLRVDFFILMFFRKEITLCGKRIERTEPKIKINS
jgi:hypothetical protein